MRFNTKFMHILILFMVLNVTMCLTVHPDCVALVCNDDDDSNCTPQYNTNATCVFTNDMCRLPGRCSDLGECLDGGVIECTDGPTSCSTGICNPLDGECVYAPPPTVAQLIEGSDDDDDDLNSFEDDDDNQYDDDYDDGAPPIVPLTAISKMAVQWDVLDATSNNDDDDDNDDETPSYIFVDDDNDDVDDDIAAVTHDFDDDDDGYDFDEQCVVQACDGVNWFLDPAPMNNMPCDTKCSLSAICVDGYCPQTGCNDNNSTTIDDCVDGICTNTPYTCNVEIVFVDDDDDDGFTQGAICYSTVHDGTGSCLRDQEVPCEGSNNNGIALTPLSNSDDDDDVFTSNVFDTDSTIVISISNPIDDDDDDAIVVSGPSSSRQATLTSDHSHSSKSKSTNSKLGEGIGIVIAIFCVVCLITFAAAFIVYWFRKNSSNYDAYQDLDDYDDSVIED